MALLVRTLWGYRGSAVTSPGPRPRSVSTAAQFDTASTASANSPDSTRKTPGPWRRCELSRAADAHQDDAASDTHEQSCEQDQVHADVSASRTRFESSAGPTRWRRLMLSGSADTDDAAILIRKQVLDDAAAQTKSWRGGLMLRRNQATCARNTAARDDPVHPGPRSAAPDPGSTDEPQVAEYSEIKAAMRDAVAPLRRRTLVPGQTPELRINDSLSITCGRKRYLLPAEDVTVRSLANTTFEALAGYLLSQVLPQLPRAGRLAAELELSELPSTSATARSDLS